VLKARPPERSGVHRRDRNAGGDDVDGSGRFQTPIRDISHAGMHGNYAAVIAMHAATCSSHLARASMTGHRKVSDFATGAKVIHLDIDPARSARCAVPTSRW